MTSENNENLILRKRINTFRTQKGALIGLPDELVISIVQAWERWTGTAKAFYQSLGIKKQQLAFIIKKGKKLFKDGKEKLGPFTPVEVKTPLSDNKNPIILNWDKNKTIKFYQVCQLVEFLKKAA